MLQSTIYDMQGVNMISIVKLPRCHTFILCVCTCMQLAEAAIAHGWSLASGNAARARNTIAYRAFSWSQARHLGSFVLEQSPRQIVIK